MSDSRRGLTARQPLGPKRGRADLRHQRRRRRRRFAGLRRPSSGTCRAIRGRTASRSHRLRDAGENGRLSSRPFGRRRGPRASASCRLCGRSCDRRLRRRLALQPSLASRRIEHIEQAVVDFLRPSVRCAPGDALAQVVRGGQDVQVLPIHKVDCNSGRPDRHALITAVGLRVMERVHSAGCGPGPFPLAPSRCVADSVPAAALMRRPPGRPA